ncbi:MAG: hypothetical protein GY798_35090 [Hyphomicrobiales bacterium]|nr:hypothetical protein [Hyphomicrobiales bacterium]
MTAGDVRPLRQKLQQVLIDLKFPIKRASWFVELRVGDGAAAVNGAGFGTANWLTRIRGRVLAKVNDSATPAGRLHHHAIGRG